MNAQQCKRAHILVRTETHTHTQWDYYTHMQRQFWSAKSFNCICLILVFIFKLRKCTDPEQSPTSESILLLPSPPLFCCRNFLQQPSSSSLCFAPISAQAQNLAAFSWSHLTNLSLSEVVVVNVVVITVVVFVIVEDLLPTPLAPLDPGRGFCQRPNLATASQSSPPSFPLRGHPSSPGDPLGELCARPWTKD